MVLAAILFSLGGILIKLSSWDALPFNAARSIVAAVTLAVYLRRPKFTFSRYQIWGAVAFAFTNLTFMIATQSTTAANAVFLQYSAPIWVVILAYFFLRERPTRIDLIAMVVIFLGMGLFFGETLSTEGMIGNLVAIASGIGLGFMTVFLRGQKEGSPAETIILGCLLSFVIGIPFFGSQSWDVTNMLLILGLGVIQLGIAFMLYSYAIKYLSAIEAMLIITLEPILNPIWVALGIGEVPGLWPTLGGLLVILAITGRALFASRATETSQA